MHFPYISQPLWYLLMIFSQWTIFFSKPTFVNWSVWVCFLRNGGINCVKQFHIHTYLGIWGWKLWKENVLLPCLVNVIQIIEFGKLKELKTFELLGWLKSNHKSPEKKLSTSNVFTVQCIRKFSYISFCNRIESQIEWTS